MNQLDDPQGLETRASKIKLIWSWAAFAVCAAFLLAQAITPGTETRPTRSSFVGSWKTIESLRVGDRVIADDPDADVPEQTQVNPATWRLLKLRAERTWPDETVSDLNVEMLQPLEWVEAQRAQVGRTVSLQLDLADLGLPDEDFPARVLAIEPCPPIRPGKGRVVLATVNQLSNDVWELTVADTTGRQSKVRTTGAHRFYREPDRAWVRASCH